MVYYVGKLRHKNAASESEHQEARNLLREIVSYYPNVRAAAIAHGMTQSNLSTILDGSRGCGKERLQRFRQIVAILRSRKETTVCP